MCLSFRTKIPVAGLGEDSSFSFFFLYREGKHNKKNTKKKIKKWPMSSQDRAKKNNKKKEKKKNTKIKMCNQSSLFALSEPQLEQSSLQPINIHSASPPTDHQLQPCPTTQLLISRERIHKQKQARNPPP